MPKSMREKKQQREKMPCQRSMSQKNRPVADHHPFSNFQSSLCPGWSAGTPLSDLYALMRKQAPCLALRPQIRLGPYGFNRMTCLPTVTIKTEHLYVLT
jgi:hypothetical protein